MEQGTECINNAGLSIFLARFARGSTAQWTQWSSQAVTSLMGSPEKGCPDKKQIKRKRKRLFTLLLIMDPLQPSRSTIIGTFFRSRRLLQLRLGPLNAQRADFTSTEVSTRVHRVLRSASSFLGRLIEEFRRSPIPCVGGYRYSVRGLGHSGRHMEHPQHRVDFPFSSPRSDLWGN